MNRFAIPKRATFLKKDASPVYVYCWFFDVDFINPSIILIVVVFPATFSLKTYISPGLLKIQVVDSIFCSISFRFAVPIASFTHAYPPLVICSTTPCMTNLNVVSELFLHRFLDVANIVT